MVKKLVVQSLVETENTQRSYWLKLNYTDIYDVYTQFQVFIKSEYVFFFFLILLIIIFFLYRYNLIITVCLFRISSYEKIFKGLVNLGLSFLGTTSSVFKSKLLN